jgi:hypothetical protein
MSGVNGWLFPTRCSKPKLRFKVESAEEWSSMHRRMVAARREGRGVQLCGVQWEERAEVFVSARYEVQEKKRRCLEKGFVSHLDVELEAVASDGRPLWSPSLLLYVGREVGDLMLGAVDCDGEEEVEGFVVDDRSSMLPVRYQ